MLHHSSSRAPIAPAQLFGLDSHLNLMDTNNTAQQLRGLSQAWFKTASCRQAA